MIDPKLKSDVNEVIRYSQNIENPMTDKLLEDWLKAKTPLMKKFFNGGVSYRSEEKITFEALISFFSGQLLLDSKPITVSKRHKIVFISTFN